LFFQVESALHWKNPLFQACVCVQEGAATDAFIVIRSVEIADAVPDAFVT
jgi:hypothetical protein